jgi:hypothetical protein
VQTLRDKARLLLDAVETLEGEELVAAQEADINDNY